MPFMVPWSCCSTVCGPSGPCANGSRVAAPSAPIHVAKNVDALSARGDLAAASTRTPRAAAAGWGPSPGDPGQLGEGSLVGSLSARARTPVRGAGSPPKGQAEPLSPEAKSRERQRLRELVQEFASEALQGRSCTLLEFSEQPRKEKGRYELHESGQRLILCSDQKSISHSWLLSSIHDVYRAEESSFVERQLQNANSVSLSKDEITCAVLLCTAAMKHPLLLIEDSPERREKLFIGLRVLRMVGSGPSDG
eukprot:gnl/MRDRNA2_/MRDRNA2_130090_c0_seq1.p1 gnl/MRDRNA2_/MRDRNA2_130090_c0~~gnl/MRDRNA2_/MRDRNA2_130090_c0_seq1.p1  ORF type:complete len:251 (+),score=42.78 gnl/MRDRNA2_/MRDRNA2_130090_c0_seq1:63-815(+)